MKHHHNSKALTQQCRFCSHLSENAASFLSHRGHFHLAFSFMLSVSLKGLFLLKLLE